MATLEQAIKQYITKTARYDGREEFQEDIEDVQILLKPVQLVIDGKTEFCTFLLDVTLEGKLGIPSYQTYWEHDPGKLAQLDYITINSIHDIAISDQAGVVEEMLVLTPEQEDKILEDNREMLEKDRTIWDECESYLEWIDEKNKY